MNKNKCCSYYINLGLNGLGVNLLRCCLIEIKVYIASVFD